MTHSHKTTSRGEKLAPGRLILGIPFVTTFTVTCTSSVLYFACLITVFSSNCVLAKKVVYNTTIIVIAFLSTMAYAVINVKFPKYRTNLFCLFGSWTNCGSTFLVFFGLIYISIEGMCGTTEHPNHNIWITKHASNYVIWTFSLIAALLQTVSHFNYL